MCSAASNRILKYCDLNVFIFSHFKVSMEVGNPDLLQWLKEQANKYLGSFCLFVPFSLSHEFHLHVLKIVATMHHIFSAICARVKRDSFFFAKNSLLIYFFNFFVGGQLSKDVFLCLFLIVQNMSLGGCKVKYLRVPGLITEESRKKGSQSIP